MPWQPLPRIAFAVATYPFAAASPADLPLEIGDELYIIEETPDGDWLRGYLVAPPSLLAGLTSVKGQTLEARVFSGVFPRSCVEVREVLGEAEDGPATGAGADGTADESGADDGAAVAEDVDSGKAGLAGGAAQRRRRKDKAPDYPNGVDLASPTAKGKAVASNPGGVNGIHGRLSLPAHREAGAERPPAPVPMLKVGDETPTSASEPLIDEIASCLREWHSTNLHGLLLARQYGRLDKLSQLITTLNLSRQQFLHNVLTAHEYNALREKTVWDLVRVNKLCGGGEVIVRDPRERGRVLTADDSIVEMTKLQSVMSLLDEPPRMAPESTALHHVLVDVKGFAGASSEATTLVLYLVARPAGESLPVVVSENFIIEIPSGGSLSNLAKATQVRTLFSDLSAQDIGDMPSAESDLYLVVKVRATQQVVGGKPGSRQGSISMSKDANKAPSTAGTKASRRSLMWGAKGSRSGFSRGGPANKLDALSEQPEEKQNGDRPNTDRLESREGVPPSTAGSKAGRSSLDGGLSPGMQTMADRTVGIGVLKLNSIMKQEEEVEHVVNIWSPSARFTQDQQDVEDWDAIIGKLLDSKSGQYEKSRRAERVQVHLKSFDNPDADALIKATPTVLANISKTNKMGFSGAPTKPRSDIYVTIDEATLARQNLLSRFGGSATSMPGGLQGSNLQVTMEVRRSSGERVEASIFEASNADGVATWKSVAAERGEPWSQHLRLSLAPQDVPGSHLVMFVADIPNPPFAVAHIPLWHNQAFVRDGTHSLLLYKVDEHTSTAQPQPLHSHGNHGANGATAKPAGGYLSLAWSSRGRDEQSAEVTGPLAVLRMETYLCSTRFSQDRAVLGLLRWKEAKKDEVPDLLRQLVFVPEMEVVKLLSDVLDALFSILVDNAGSDEYEDLVFTALVRVLGIVHDRRFNLGPLVDQYAESRFNYPFATPCLVRSFTRLLSRPTEPETARKLRATFKVVRQILKFITHARDQQKEKEAGIGITTSTPGFSRHLRSIFKALDAMMQNTAPVLVGSQTLAVQHFHTWLPELAGLLTTEEIVYIAVDFMDSCAGVRGKLVLYKLVLIINYSKLDLFSHPEQRSVLSANTARWIAPHWGALPPPSTDQALAADGLVTEQWKEQVRLCCSVLASQVDHLGPEIPDYIPKILDSYLAIRAAQEAGPQSPPPAPQRHRPRSRLSLLFPTQYPFPTRPVLEPVYFDEALMELSALLSTLSNSPPGMQLELAEDDLAVLLEKTLRVHMSILDGEAFPANWLSVHIYHHKSTMRTLQYLGGILLESFLPHPDDAESFSTELWKMFFVTLLKLVGSSSLALETFPDQKRRAVWKIAGDVREHGAELLRRTWEAIGWETSPDERARYGLGKMGGYQVQYVPTLVGPIVELCLSVHEGLRRMAVEVLQTMIVSEWTLSEDLSVIQTEAIDCLDVFFKSKPLTESILQKLFVAELLDRFQPLSLTADEPLYAALRELVATVDEFLDLLVAVHSGDTGEASNLIHRLRLMEFLRDMQKEEIFVRYVHQLAALQAEARNHTEAGLALKLHADLYDWDPVRTTPALADPDFPQQSLFERRERLYFDMIKHFEEGEAWSSALAAYRELQAQYETNVFDLAKLARTGRAVANIHETISKSDKLVPKYFKVIYKGLGFSASLRDKEFVFEGSPTERTSAFTDRMQESYPNARIMANGDADEVEDVEGQYLVISALSPHRDLSHLVYRRARVPHVVRDYLLTASGPGPQVFSVSTKRTTTGPVATHWAEKLVYTTLEPFPTILRRSEIVSAQEIRLSAKETALERIVRKTQEMAAVERRLAEGDEEVAQLLIDAVSISVNAQSENSIVCYRQLLPRGANIDGEDREVDDDEEVELDDQETAIKMALVDHAIMIKRCLATFARSNKAIPTSRHEELQKHFEATFAPEIVLFTPPAPPPVTRDYASSPSPSNWRRSSPSDAGGMSGHHRNNSINAILTNGHHRNGSDPSTPATATGAGQPGGGRQARARLSFLGGRRKDSNGDAAMAGANGDGSGGGGDAPPGSRRSSSKDGMHRRSFFRSHSEDKSNSNNGYADNTAGGADWVTDSAGNTGPGTNRESVDQSRSTGGKAGGAAAQAQQPQPQQQQQQLSGPEKEKAERDRVQREKAMLQTMHSLEGVGQGAPPQPGGIVKMGSVRKRLSLLRLGGGGAAGGKKGDAMKSLDEE